MECFKNHGFENEARLRFGTTPRSPLRYEVLRWGFFYYRRGRKRSFGQLGVPPRGWGASPPSINLPTPLPPSPRLPTSLALRRTSVLRRTSRRAGFGLAEGKATTDFTDYTDLICHKKAQKSQREFAAGV